MLGVEAREVSMAFRIVMAAPGVAMGGSTLYTAEEALNALRCGPGDAKARDEETGREYDENGLERLIARQRKGR